MNIYRITNGLTFILLMMCTLLIVVIFYEWRTMGDNAKPIDAANQVNNELDPETGILSSISQTNIAINQFTEIINRPLFVEVPLGTLAGAAGGKEDG